MNKGYGTEIFLNKAKRSDPVTLDTHIGKRVNLHTTALGKAILSGLRESDVDEIIDRHGLPAVIEKPITDTDRLKDQLAVTRDRGYATDDEDRVLEMRCIAALSVTKIAIPSARSASLAQRIGSTATRSATKSLRVY